MYHAIADSPLSALDALSIQGIGNDRDALIARAKVAAVQGYLVGYNKQLADQQNRELIAKKIERAIGDEGYPWVTQTAFGLGAIGLAYLLFKKG